MKWEASEIRESFQLSKTDKVQRLQLQSQLKQGVPWLSVISEIQNGFKPPL